MGGGYFVNPRLILIALALVGLSVSTASSRPLMPEQTWTGDADITFSYGNTTRKECFAAAQLDAYSEGTHVLTLAPVRGTDFRDTFCNHLVPTSVTFKLQNSTRERGLNETWMEPHDCILHRFVSSPFSSASSSFDFRYESRGVDNEHCNGSDWGLQGISGVMQIRRWGSGGLVFLQR